MRPSTIVCDYLRSVEVFRDYRPTKTFELQKFWTAPSLRYAMDNLISVPAQPETWNDSQQEAFLMEAFSGFNWGPKTRFLDFGAGIGRMTRALALHRVEVHAVDVSRNLLEFARVYCKDLDNVFYHFSNGYDCGNVFDLSIENAFSFYTFQHMLSWDMIESCLFAIQRAVIPGGYVRIQSRMQNNDGKDGYIGVTQGVNDYLFLGEKLGQTLFDVKFLSGGEFYVTWINTPTRR